MNAFKVLPIVAVLAGCASSPDYDSYLKAQAEANRQALEQQKPLIRITAQPGMQITGLQSLEVYTPSAVPVIQQARPSEWAGVLQTGLGVVGTLGGIKLGGDAAIGLASQMRQAGTAGYPYVQNPLVQPAPLVVNAPAPVVVRPEVINTPSPVVVNPQVINTPSPVIVRPEVIAVPTP